jgi:DNA-binding PadR family transcriptional regulator
MRRDPRDFLPLKDLVFRILVALADGERAALNLAEALDETGDSGAVLPGHLYRTLDRMLADGLVREEDGADDRVTPAKRGPTTRRFFSLTPLGVEVARAETRRLAALVEKSRNGRLIGQRR